MRKKIAMRKGGKVAKFAGGGLAERVGEGIVNAIAPGVGNAMGASRRGSEELMRRSGRPTEEGGREMAPYEVVVEAERPPPRRRSRVSRSRAMSADDLNDREMTRILNERSLEAARAGRNMYKKGGRVVAKKK